jgi:putative MATE family efflux protein
MTRELTDIEMSNAPYRTIWRLSWPQVLMMVFHFLIGFADVWVAGRIDMRVQASMGMITQALFFLLVVAMAVANGSVAAISQSIGAGLYRRVQRYVGLVLTLGVAGGLVFLALGLPARGVILTLMRVPDELREITNYFLTVFLYSLPSYYLLTVTQAVFRAQKRVLFPLYSMMIVTLVNVLLDFGLGLGMWGFPDLGYRGVVWATFASVTGGALYNVAMLWRHSLVRRESFAPWRWVRAAVPYLFRVAWPAGLMQVLWHLGYLVLYAITATLPQDRITALAGMTTGIRVESALFLPAFAFNMTAGILVGHYLGAGRPDEAKRFGLRIWRIGVIGITIMTLCLWPAVGPLTRFISPDGAVSAEAVNYLFFNVLAMPFTVTSMIMGGVFTGAGATVYNLVTFSLAAWGLRLPLAWVLGHYVLGRATGVWVSMLVSQIAQAAAMYYIFSRKNWPRFSMQTGRTNRHEAKTDPARPASA